MSKRFKELRKQMNEQKITMEAGAVNISEGGVKAALEDYLYSIPKEAIEELRPIMKMKNLPQRFREITRVLKKYGFTQKFMGSFPNNVVNDYYDTYFGESVEQLEAKAKKADDESEDVSEAMQRPSRRHMDGMVDSVLQTIVGQHIQKKGDARKIMNTVDTGNTKKITELLIPYVEDIVERFEKNYRDILVSDTDIVEIAKRVSEKLISNRKNGYPGYVDEAMVKVALNPNKSVGYQVTDVGPGGSRTVSKSENFPEEEAIIQVREAGHQTLYRYKGKYYIVSYSSLANETAIFAGDAKGKPTSYIELWGEKGGVHPDAAIKEFLSYKFKKNLQVKIGR